MATRIYYLRNDKTRIAVSVAPVTIGIVSTVIKLKKTGGSATHVGDSGSDATGTVAKLACGIASDLLNSVLVLTTVVSLTAVPKNQWAKAFKDLRIDYHLEGGLDGPQDYNVDIDDKTQIMDNKFIVATKAIKFNTH